MKKFLAILTMAVVVLSGGKNPNTDNQSVSDIIKRIEKENSTLTTYRDNSTVTEQFITDNPFTVIKKSKIVYSSDGRFRFEYYKEGQANTTYIIHRDAGGVVKSWWDVTSELKTYNDLSEPLAAATGVSSESAFLMPSILLPSEFEGHNIFKVLTGLSRGDDVTIDGKECFLITGYNLFDDLCSLYIIKDNYAIRRYTHSHEYDNFKLDSQLDIYPEIDVTISDAEFLFNHPKGQ